MRPSSVSCGRIGTFAERDIAKRRIDRSLDLDIVVVVGRRVGRWSEVEHAIDVGGFRPQIDRHQRLFAFLTTEADLKWADACTDDDVVGRGVCLEDQVIDIEVDAVVARSRFAPEEGQAHCQVDIDVEVQFHIAVRWSGQCSLLLHRNRGRQSAQTGSFARR